MTYREGTGVIGIGILLQELPDDDSIWNIAPFFDYLAHVKAHIY